MYAPYSLFFIFSPIRKFDSHFFLFLNLFAIVSSLQKKNLNYFKIDDFFTLYLYKQINLKLQKFFAENLEQLNNKNQNLRQNKKSSCSSLYVSKEQ